MVPSSRLLKVFDYSKRRYATYGKTKKSIPPVKNREIKIRFTEELYDVLTKDALAARLPRTEYIRQLILNHHPVIKQEIVFDSSEVLEIFRGLGNCRGNLNQIAKHLNQGGEPSEQARNQVIDCISELYEMRDKLEEIVGEYRGSH